MDAEHRHELKTNELAEWMVNFPQFVKENSNKIIGVSLIVIGLISWPLFNKMKTQSEVREQSEVISMIDMAEQARLNYANPQQNSAPAEPLTVLAQTLQEQADKAGNPDLSALALIKKGNALRADIHLGDILTDDMISSHLSDARTAYETAFKKAKMPTLKGLAQIGLGLCAEETGEYDEAREIYESIVADDSYKATVAPTEAQRRLDSLEENSSDITFAPAPEKPQTAPAVPVTPEDVPMLLPPREQTAPAPEAPARQ